MRIPVAVRAIMLAAVPLLASMPAEADDAGFRSCWPRETERAWIGPEYWSNPLPDWRVSAGRLECHRSGGDRNVYLLTRELAPRPGGLELSVALGQLEMDNLQLTGGWVGFKVGSRGEFNDYRDSAVRGD
ncbi:MAG: hypothetical protein JXQ83_07505, partial [Candidatus Glassbacteria bacterium]|nr:hypothetical protein [Candidatus Glassbacteria bacterium]